MRHFFINHKKTFFGVLVAVLFSATISLATPPTGGYAPGATLDPDCAPNSSSDCTVRILPDQTGNTGKYLTTNGTTTSWATVAGSGVTSINGLTGATQTFAIGTSGTTPTFSSASTTHTLNIPMAATSGTTAGLLSKTQYDTFNIKQAALVSGANIKTINSSTLLGSGDISVATLIGYTPYNATNPSGYIASYGIGSAVTSGISKSVLFVNTSGQLAQDDGFEYNPAGKTLKFGNSDSHAITATGTGSLAFGYTESAGSINNQTASSLTFGYTAERGSIVSSGDSTSNLVFGSAQNDGQIVSDGSSNLVFGTALNTGSIRASANNQSLIFGSANSGGVLMSSNTDSTLLFGNVSSGGSIITTGRSSFAFGVSTGGQIYTNGQSSLVFGTVDSNTDSKIHTNGNNSIAFGSAGGGSSIYTNGSGIAHGDVYGEDGNGNFSYINASTGAHGFGAADSGGYIIAGSEGSSASGYTTGSDSNGNVSFITADSQGAFVSGYTTDGGYLYVGGSGAFVMGFAQGRGDNDVSYIRANASGSMATGEVHDGGYINAYARGSQVAGYAQGQDGNGNASYIQTGSNADGSQAFGSVTNGGNIFTNTNQAGSLAFGVSNAEQGSIYTGGRGAAVFGYIDAGATNGQLYTGAYGAFTFGSIEGANGSVHTNGEASQAFGLSYGGQIYTNGQSSLVFGTVDDNTDSQIYTNGDNSLAFGYAAAGASLNTGDAGAIVSGYAYGQDGNGNFSYLRAGNVGSEVHGYADSGAYLYASGYGSLVHGYASGSDVDGNISYIIAAGESSSISGSAYGGGYMYAADRAFAFGTAQGTDGNGSRSYVDADAEESLAWGGAFNGGYIVAAGQSSQVFGYADGSSNGTVSFLETDGIGSFTFGNATSAGHINTTSDGSLGYGLVNDSGSIVAGGGGSTAGGLSIANGLIATAAQGSFAYGYVDNGAINAGANGVFVGGYANNAYAVSSTGRGSFTFGDATDGDVLNTGIGSIVVGGILVNNSNYGGVFGQYGTIDINSNNSFLFALGGSMTTLGAPNTFAVGYDGGILFQADSSGVTISNLTITGSCNVCGGGSIPSQSAHSGEYLTTDGTNLSWGTISSSFSPDSILSVTLPSGSFGTIASFGANGGAGLVTIGYEDGSGISSITGSMFGPFQIASSSNNNILINPGSGNVGIKTVSPNHTLDVNGNIGVVASGYINFGSTDGSSGYGLFDNAGTLQFKNSGGSWINLGGGTLDGNNSFIVGGGASVSYSNFFGANAGKDATTASYSNIFGLNAGNGATDAHDSNFFGGGAGISATNANNSNFFGAGAGDTATNANNSNFFGTNAGQGATGANNSNFFGLSAGRTASNAAYSNLFGYKAGMSFVSNSLGSNNIIIGTNISLPNTTANAINIGGIIFGTGTYSTTTGNPSIAAISGGKIGIGVVSPNHTLDINGNIGLATSKYINFGSTDGSSGYGLFDNAGTLQFKNSGGSWTNLGGVSLNSYSMFIVGGGNSAALNAGSIFIGNTAGDSTTNTAYAQFIGYQSGYQATGAGRSNFIGLNTGYQTTNAAESNFIGDAAGYTATNANNSNFIGVNTGFSAINASYSNIFGYQAGYENGTGIHIGSNNIIIGTNISLPNATTNAINLGGVLFGTGTYSTTTGNPSVAAVTSGKIGIAKVTPAYTLDVGNSSVSGIVAQFTNSTGSCTINPNTTSLSCSSDIRLKKNITLLSNTSPFVLNTIQLDPGYTVLQKLSLLSPATYNWNSELDTDQKHAGFIAQQVEQVFPDLVATDAITGFKSINYMGFAPYTVRAIQELDIHMNAVVPESLDATAYAKIKEFLQGIALEGKGMFDTVQTKKLCVDDICVTRDQFKKMLENSQSAGSQNVQAQVVPPTADVPAVPVVQAPAVDAPAVLVVDQAPIVADPAAQ